jgi:hypothetical protein
MPRGWQDGRLEGGIGHSAFRNNSNKKIMGNNMQEVLGNHGNPQIPRLSGDRCRLTQINNPALAPIGSVLA